MTKKMYLYKLLKEKILKNENENKIKDDDLIQYLLKTILNEERRTSEKILKYLDLSNIKFDDQDIVFIDFTNTNAKIDPQKIHLKHMGYTKLNGLDFKDKSFDNVYISGVDFTGAKNVIINPQKIANKNLKNSIVKGVDFNNYSFEGVNTTNTKFEGSLNCKYKWQEDEYEKYKRKIKSLF